MVETEKLIYIQMQKTGSTHIAKILDEIFGDSIKHGPGKHKPPDQNQIHSGKLIISSIRNPWEWYVSLWTFGTEGKGGLKNRLVRSSQPAAGLKQATSPSFPIRSKLSGQILNKPLQGSDRHSSCQPTTAVEWQKLYARKDCKESFRAWLHRIHDPINSHSLGKGYGDSALSSLCGFMSYRYLYLCCQSPEGFSDQKSFRDYADIARYDRNNCYINIFIRQESLAKDLCEAIQVVHPLSSSERMTIYAAARTNQSHKRFPTAYYYDPATLAIVRNREKLLIDKFGYTEPNLNEVRLPSKSS